MMMVAITNGHIMGTDAHCAIFEKADFACSKQILIGKKCAKLMALGSNFSVSISETHLVLENSDMIIVQRMDDNRYPDLLAVVPKQPAIEMTVAKKDLEATVKRADVCANPYTRMIVFEVNGRLTISANNLDFDTSYKRQISCEHSGDDLKIGLNSRFLLNLIKTIKSPEITFSFTENTKAFLINKSALQMPVALNQF
jgi:DNA polymerase-3 subunit beta